MVEEHDRNLWALFQRLEERNVTINWPKCKIRQSIIRYFGLIWSKEGVKPDPKKTTSILNMTDPTTVAEVRSFLGMVTYMSRFIPNFATITKPLRDLTKKDVPFDWTEECTAATSELKRLISREPVLSYFDTQLPTELTVDASPVGLGAILSQTTPSGEQKIVAFASKALNPTEQRYSQFEREALAVLWSCDHFRIFILGKPVTVYTDHRPLESVFNGRTLHPNLRIQKWVARAQPYGITVKHIPGSTNPADYMSRHPIDDDYLSAAARSANRFVNFVAQQSTPKAFKLVDVATATTEDPVLTAVIKATKTGD